jgi:hypothetical protein
MAVAATKRDYSLTGRDASLSIENGLSAAQWYACPIPRKDLKDMMKRKDGPALRDTALWFAALLNAGGLPPDDRAMRRSTTPAMMCTSGRRFPGTPCKHFDAVYLARAEKDVALPLCRASVHLAEELNTALRSRSDAWSAFDRNSSQPRPNLAAGPRPVSG